MPAPSLQNGELYADRTDASSLGVWFSWSIFWENNDRPFSFTCLLPSVKLIRTLNRFSFSELCELFSYDRAQWSILFEPQREAYCFSYKFIYRIKHLSIRTQFVILVILLIVFATMFVPYSVVFDSLPIERRYDVLSVERVLIIYLS